MKKYALFLLAVLLIVVSGCKKNDISNDSIVTVNPLCFVAEEDSATIGINFYGLLDPSLNIEFSYDGNVWERFVPDSVITLKNIGDKVYFRGNNPRGLNINYESTYRHLYFLTNEKKIAASGNIMSLIDPTCKSRMVPDNCFLGLFEETSITSAPKLPANVLGRNCYASMFGHCSNLIAAPELPATSLADGCYNSMFNACINLTKVPDELPATVLKPDCYVGMFYGCQSLIEAPKLPATTLVTGCYAFMFSACASLISAPELPATELADFCYNNMFDFCTNLNSIKVYFTGWNGESEAATTYWVYNVAPTGMFYCPRSLYLEFGNSRVPEGWEIKTF